MADKTQEQKYRIRGLHCSSCEKEFLSTYQNVLAKNNVRYDEDSGVFLINDETNWRDLEKIMSFEKVYFEKVDDEASIEEVESKGQHLHGHEHNLENQSVFKMWSVFAINLFFSIFEFIFGILFNSAAILSDSVHDLGDAVSIGVAALLEGISKNEPNSRFSFGYKRFSLLGSLVTATVLIVGSILNIVHAVPRLFAPEVVNETGIFWIAIFAIAANGLAAWILRDSESANESMLNLHLLEDVLGWIAVLVVSVILQFTDWYILDPILSIAIAIYILIEAFSAVKETAVVFLEGVPSDLDGEAIEQAISAIPEIEGISHFHLWSLDGQAHSLSLTVSVDSQEIASEEAVKREIRDVVFPYGITHVTIETVPDI